MNTKKSVLIAASALALTFAACQKEAISPDAAALTGQNNKSQTERVVSPYVTRVLEYKPAPGQFINATYGSQSDAQNVIGVYDPANWQKIVTLGAYGGYIIFGFDHSITNQANKTDFIIYGNAFESNGNYFSEPGVVWVSRDVNANGLADDPWYQIKGSYYNNTATKHNYVVTYTLPSPQNADVPWTSNTGDNGLVLRNSWHTQASYYPLWLGVNSYALGGTRLPDNYAGGPTITGYADSTPDGDKIDISWAVNASGNPVSLASIDFVKVQSGIQKMNGTLGEVSTEVAGAADLSLLP
ncbi:hypothetical protein KTO58_21945 [Chitinophaga pendula]|uniref:cell surface protein n=1 Tax=Chitinophaga TaxID=79328 RepID=UPI000BAFB14F|nr:MULTISPECIES: cell surface protein [Chitinophaga]ASZ10715.1 cell surface protein [Chitinophaga sp. MD30]UCJ06310.1 hypothetical protein KTO58_21945 [Chitinophaga pendula]